MGKNNNDIQKYFQFFLDNRIKIEIIFVLDVPKVLKSNFFEKKMSLGIRNQKSREMIFLSKGQKTVEGMDSTPPPVLIELRNKTFK